MQPGMTTFCHTRAARHFVFENVPALICSQCGERSFDGPAFDTIQRIIRQDCPPTRIVEVGVYDLAATPWATAASP
jgi:YgiT-type zinc finger domain-containing protein